MTFNLDPDNFKKVYDRIKNITVKLDYNDSNNKFIIYTNYDVKESFIIVDNRNLSCEVYINSNTDPKIISCLQEALPILGFSQNKIFFISSK